MLGFLVEGVFDWGLCGEGWVSEFLGGFEDLRILWVGFLVSWSFWVW